jgi:OmpA-OmpF porin, OOP family
MQAMKKITMMFLILLMSEAILAQEQIGKRVIQRSKDQTTNRVESRSEQGVEGALNKIEEGIGSLFKKREKKNPTSTNQDADDIFNDSSIKPNGGNQEISGRNSGAGRNSVNSKFDFISGEKVIAYDNFERVEIGDFPVDWNTNASGEIVLFDEDDTKWLYLSNTGLFVPDMVNTLPENFTLEFDITVSEDFSNSMGGFKTVLVQKMADRMQYDIHFNEDPQVRIDIHPLPEGILYSYISRSSTGAELRNQGHKDGDFLEIYRISMWRQGTRMRVYINDEKVLDLPRAFSSEIEYALLFGTNYWSGELFVSDFKIAIGEPDTRSKLITEGKFVTNSITFDSGSDVLKNSSYGVLKEIAETLQQNPSVRVQILGHTDSDGSESLNLDLSKRRAAAVKRALSNDFGIEDSRMETDGRGQSQPVAPNNTSEGKAQNRRVEFIKL